MVSGLRAKALEYIVVARSVYQQKGQLSSTVNFKLAEITNSTSSQEDNSKFGHEIGKKWLIFHVSCRLQMVLKRHNFWQDERKRLN